MEKVDLLSMSIRASTPSADDSRKQQLTERFEESEYETISQDESLGSPTVTPYTIDNDFSFSSPRPSKKTRAHEKPTTHRTIEQSKSPICGPGFKHHSQKQVAHEEDSDCHQPEVTASPSGGDAAASTSIFSSTASIHRKGANRQNDQGSTQKSSSLSQNTQASLPNNQQATMSPHARANLSQQMNSLEATDQQQPFSSPSASVDPQQQQHESGHHRHVHIRIFILPRRAPGALAVLIYYLLNVLKIMFFASILYFMYTKEMIPLPPSSGREKLYVLKRM